MLALADLASGAKLRMVRPNYRLKTDVGVGRFGQRGGFKGGQAKLPAGSICMPQDAGIFSGY